jgi:GAF domain-containing protein
MKRRSRAGASVKPRRRKVALQKRRGRTGAVRPRSSSAVSQESEAARLASELSAMAEILRLISSSPGNVGTVLWSLAEQAAQICQARYVDIFIVENDNLRKVAWFGEIERTLSFPLDRFSASGRSVCDMRTVSVDDMQNAGDEFTLGREVARKGGRGSLVAVPLIHEGRALGTIVVSRAEVRPFEQKHIELLTRFAAQAVIAIENARLLDELRERTADLSESLQQQTATADVLRIISSSPGELQPVFQAILENATRICDAKFGVLFRFDGGLCEFAADVGTPLELAEFVRRRGCFLPAPETQLYRVLRTGSVAHTADYATVAPNAPPAKLGGARSTVDVPMFKDSVLVGAISIYRQEVRPFTEKQIALLQNFAAQAVIAIENTRLLNELRQRTSDLSESLEQTATSEVLGVISTSPGELEPVFQAVLANATRILQAELGMLWLADGDGFRAAALHGVPPDLAGMRQREKVFHFNPEVPLGRLAQTKQLDHVVDAKREPGYIKGVEPFKGFVDVIGAGTFVLVPMLQDDALVGVIAIYRKEVRPFTDKQIALVQSFAAQAVIAIENTRLLNELRERTTDLTESLEQQTATSEVLSVISSSPGRLESVFRSMLENAVRICRAKFGFMLRYDGDAYHTVAELCDVPAYIEEMRRSPLQPHPESALGRVARTKEFAQISDITAHRLYTERDPIFVAGAELGGRRTIAAVPMLKDQQLIGAITIFRKEVRPLTDKQIALLQNFAAQAVIAIENTRLLNELRRRTEQIAKLNQHLEQRVTDQVGEIERMSRLRRFLPPQVADLIVASGTERQLESHRREITALFCDLRGFTGFSESSDPEDVMALLREYHAAIGKIIIKYSGTLERYAGDGVMVVFNDPVPVENPALQAVLMSLEMREAIGALIEKWRDLGHELGFGIGIAHGFATLGTIGFEGRFDYAAIGTVSNVASRLCDEAKPGQILITPRVRQAVENAVTIKPVGEFALKGLRRPMLTYNVLEVSRSKSG